MSLVSNPRFPFQGRPTRAAPRQKICRGGWAGGFVDVGVHGCANRGMENSDDAGNPTGASGGAAGHATGGQAGAAGPGEPAAAARAALPAAATGGSGPGGAAGRRSVDRRRPSGRGRRRWRGRGSGGRAGAPGRARWWPSGRARDGGRGGGGAGAAAQPGRPRRGRKAAAPARPGAVGRAVRRAAVVVPPGARAAPPGPGGPCAGLCVNPVVFTAVMYQSGDLGTNATCHQTTAAVQGLECGNFVAPRQLTVNGQTFSCTGTGMPLPAAVNGGYCIQATRRQQLVRVLRHVLKSSKSLRRSAALTGNG